MYNADHTFLMENKKVNNFKFYCEGNMTQGCNIKINLKSK